SAQEKQHRNLLARETPQLTIGLKRYQQLVSKYDFAGAAAVIRKLSLTEPSLRQTQSDYENVAEWLAEWKATLINDLNARGYNGAVVVNNTQYSGVAGATAGKLRIKVPYGVAETDWVNVAAPTLLMISS